MAVAVVVSDGRPHSGLFAPVFVERRSCGHRNVSKSSIMIIAIQNAGSAVARDKNIRPPVFIEVERRDAERIVAVGAIDVRLCRDVFKCSIAAIVVKNIFRSGQSARPAHHRNALPDARRTLSRCGSSRQIEVHIIRNDQIKMAIAIVVDERTSGSPGFS